MSESTYGLGLSNAGADEERRLAAMELMFDPGSFRYLDRIGIAAGMQCLELGGGGGSVARWMAERVGPSGFVLVTDIDVSRLTECDRPNMEVRVHDVCTDPLDEGRFDVIHARLLLEHLPSRVTVLDNLVTALRPGGWLLVEDFDFSALLHLPEERLLCEPKELRATVQAFCRANATIGMTSGWDGEFGRDLPLHLVHAGLDRVDGETCSPLTIGGSPQSAFFTVSTRQVGPAVSDAGFVSWSDLQRMINAFEKPGAMLNAYSMVSAWGHRP
jgi:SAM-dependent methyltransferase